MPGPGINDFFFEGEFIEEGAPVGPPSEMYPQSRPELKRYNFVPELNFWVRNLIENCSPVAQEFLQIPTPISEEEWRQDGTVLDLLFNYTYCSPTYSICYQKKHPSTANDKQILQRYPIYASRLDLWTPDASSNVDVTMFPTDSTNFGLSTEIIECDPRPDTIECVLCDGSSVFHTTESVIKLDNIFDITYGEKDMLDLLQNYKLGNPVDLNIVNFDQLPSALSRLIYIYLDFEINERFTLYDSNNPITNDSRLIEWLYEKWVIDCIYRQLEFMPSLVFDCNGSFEEVRKSWQLMKLDQNNINTKSISFPPDRIPIGEEDIFLVLDAHKQKLKEDYDYFVDTSDATAVISAVVWNNLGMESKANVNDPVYLLWSHRMNAP
jgi:hypothetical protein